MLPPSLSKADPSSFSNPEEAVVTALFLNFIADFVRNVLVSEVKLTIKKIIPDASHIFLDCSNLHIKSIVDNGTGHTLNFNISEPIEIFGSKLDIELPSDKSEIEVLINYETDPKAFALQWLPAEQTAGRKHPYLYSQCQPIHARSIIPCQDTPSVKTPYSAKVTAPTDLTVLMSALRDGAVESSAGQRTHSFHQPVPVPSYLVALVVGELEGRKLGPRSTVWAEPQQVDMAAYEFSETEKFIETAESLCGPYVWGIYDLLVLPPSFPFGGMENPCLTFVTPTLLAGDRSLANVVAHEISHSWTGNLVTNCNFDHFWLNEGFTMYLERKIIGRLNGESMRQFAAINGLKDLKYAVKTLGEENPLTKLVVDLSGGIGPDDAFSSCPYEKGHTFLFYLEQLVGGPDVFEPFFKTYIDKFKYQSIDTIQFKKFFESYFTNTSSSKEVEWEKWLYTPGMPYNIPEYNTTLLDACTTIVNRWKQWNTTEPAPFTPEDFSSLQSLQKEEVLAQMLELEPPLPLEKLQAMQIFYNLDSNKNAEIKFKWLRLCLRARWEEKVKPALAFVTEQGRLKYVRPIYRDLYNWEAVRQLAIDNFKANRAFMAFVTAYNVSKDLHLE